MEEWDKQCVYFWRMSIIEQLNYDSTNDQIMGEEDHGEKGRSNKLATYALVYMICGLLKKWK